MRKVDELSIDEGIAFDVLEIILEAGKNGIRMGKLVDDVFEKDSARHGKKRDPCDILSMTADVIYFWVEQEKKMTKKSKKEDTEVFYVIVPEKKEEVRRILKRALGI